MLQIRNKAMVIRVPFAKTDRGILARTKFGFTLIELLVVIAVIGILGAMLIPLTGKARASARQAQCASNLRQIGMALRLYADENDGLLPGIAHLRVEDSWVFALRPYLDNVNEIRICPSDPRADRMREVDWATSYVMNDIIFFPSTDEFGRPAGEDFRRIDALQAPSRTILAFIEADHRGIAPSDDHTHATDWGGNWSAVLNDIAPDRHRAGGEDPSRTTGNANYLFADGHVQAIRAAEIRQRIESGENIALPPELR